MFSKQKKVHIMAISPTGSGTTAQEETLTTRVAQRVSERFKVGESDLPIPIVVKILQQLECPRDIARCAGVSRLWHEVARDPEVVMAVLCRTLGLTIIDEVAWKEHFVLPESVSFDDASQFNPVTALPTIDRHLSLPIEADAGVTLLTLPRGLTFNKLVELGKSPAQVKV